MVDLFLLLLAPGAGDELQGVKRGIVELADLVVVNKADGALLEPARHTASDYAHALHLVGQPEVQVLLTSALENAGIAEAWAAVEAHARAARTSGALAALAGRAGTRLDVVGGDRDPRGTRTRRRARRAAMSTRSKPTSWPAVSRRPRQRTGCWTADRRRSRSSGRRRRPGSFRLARLADGAGCLGSGGLAWRRTSRASATPRRPARRVRSSSSQSGLRSPRSRPGSSRSWVVSRCSLRSLMVGVSPEVRQQRLPTVPNNRGSRPVPGP